MNIRVTVSLIQVEKNDPVFKVEFGSDDTISMEPILPRTSAATQARSFSSSLALCSRDARGFVFKPKIPIWVNFGGYWNGKCWYILCPFGLFYGNLVYFVVIWSILWPFGIFFPVLVCCTKKNLATLLCSNETFLPLLPNLLRAWNGLEQN
jgi:hypothetical protein